MHVLHISVHESNGKFELNVSNLQREDSTESERLFINTIDSSFSFCKT